MYYKLIFIDALNKILYLVFYKFPAKISLDNLLRLNINIKLWVLPSQKLFKHLK